MAFELRQELKLSQQLVMTMQLQQAIKLLQLSHLELVELLQEEMKENPVLVDAEQEENVISNAADVKGKVKDDAKESDKYIESKKENEKKIEEYLANYNNNYYSSYRETEEKERYESVVVKKTSLVDHLTWQMRLSDFNEKEREIGIVIINNLSDDGYLSISIEELHQMCDSPRELILQVLNKIQDFDPTGIAARDLRECLLKQAESLQIKNPVVIRIIKDHLKNLEIKSYKAISRSLKVSVDVVYNACKIILSLEPKPGRILSTDDVHYIVPDVHIYKIGDKYIISLNEDGLPKLRVSQYYRNILASREKSESSKVAKEYIQNKLRSAEWLIKSIQQRQKTIYKVAESILKIQKEFFNYGIGHLKPLILRDVAEDIGRHESTVSRVTSNKYVYTPHGLFKLSYFFTNSVDTTNGDEKVSSENVKERIKKIIGSENNKKPFSDQAISIMLKNENIIVARRTVAKYRENMKILPSKSRRRAF
jgi:RNA polymerase sigma-54 factor